MKDIENQIRLQATHQLRGAVNSLIYQIVEELPQGHSSSIADELFAVEVEPGHFWVYGSQTWVFLNDGTGIYSDKHRGRGPNGEIVPYNAKKLHFKNGQLAMALGFKDENVFLAKCNGIQPRFYWDRYFRTERIGEEMAKAQP